MQSMQVTKMTLKLRCCKSKIKIKIEVVYNIIDRDKCDHFLRNVAWTNDRDKTSFHLNR